MSDRNGPTGPRAGVLPGATAARKRYNHHALGGRRAPSATYWAELAARLDAIHALRCRMVRRTCVCGEVFEVFDFAPSDATCGCDEVQR